MKNKLTRELKNRLIYYENLYYQLYQKGFADGTFNDRKSATWKELERLWTEVEKIRGIKSEKKAK